MTDCNIIFEPAFYVCCETNDAKCKKLAQEASEIECLINGAKNKGEDYVFVNKHMLNEELIKALQDSCYLVEFFPNSGRCGCRGPEASIEDLNGTYRISWCDICSSSSASSYCCSSSWSCDDIPVDSGSSCDCEPCDPCCSEPTPPPVDSGCGC